MFGLLKVDKGSDLIVQDQIKDNEYKIRVTLGNILSLSIFAFSLKRKKLVYSYYLSVWEAKIISIRLPRKPNMK